MPILNNYLFELGLVMKLTDLTSIEEVVAMRVAEAAGIPIPGILSCGEHSVDSDSQIFFILMTRVPGIPLENLFDSPQVDIEELWLHELNPGRGSIPRNLEDQWPIACVSKELK
jgi:hypothetical protein